MQGRGCSPAFVHLRVRFGPITSPAARVPFAVGINAFQWPMTETAITAPGEGTIRASLLVAPLLGLAALLAPAWWNGYPLLQYDTGGYLARWYEGYLVPSRSTVFGLFLHVGEGLHFWPELLLQAGCTVWVISLVLRVFGLGGGPWRSAIVVVGLSCVTALPFLSSTLLTDIFAGLAVLSLYLVLFHRAELARAERFGLLSLIAFAAASHNATLAVLLAIMTVSIPVSLLSGVQIGRASGRERVGV